MKKRKKNYYYRKIKIHNNSSTSIYLKSGEIVEPKTISTEIFEVEAQAVLKKLKLEYKVVDNSYMVGEIIDTPTVSIIESSHYKELEEEIALKDDEILELKREIKNLKTKLTKAQKKDARKDARKEE